MLSDVGSELLYIYIYKRNLPFKLLKNLNLCKEKFRS